MSRLAESGEGKAIRGGVPVIFPQFSDRGPLPRHGFVRTTAWKVTSQSTSQATLRLESSEATLSLWPHPFIAEMIVNVGGNALTMALRITNSGTSSFFFDAALHTYLAVSDISSVQIVGLQGHQYLDSLTKLRQAEVPDVIRFKGEVDRGYYEVREKALKLVEPNRTLTIRSVGFPDAVVWNPGDVTGSKIKDLEPDGFRRFVCIEAAAIGQPVTLAPGQSWEGKQILEAD